MATKFTLGPWADCPLCGSADIHTLRNQTYTDNIVLQCNGCNTRFEMDTPNVAEAREIWNERRTSNFQRSKFENIPVGSQLNNHLVFAIGKDAVVRAEIDEHSRCKTCVYLGRTQCHKTILTSRNLTQNPPTFRVIECNGYTEETRTIQEINEATHPPIKDERTIEEIERRYHDAIDRAKLEKALSYNDPRKRLFEFLGYLKMKYAAKNIILAIADEMQQTHE